MLQHSRLTKFNHVLRLIKITDEKMFGIVWIEVESVRHTGRPRMMWKEIGDKGLRSMHFSKLDAVVYGNCNCVDSLVKD